MARRKKVRPDFTSGEMVVPDSLCDVKLSDRWGVRAISLTAPWGTLMAWGLKKNETRSWQPSTAVPPFWLAIHQAKGLSNNVLDIAIQNETIISELCRVLHRDRPRDDDERRKLIKGLPRGKIVALVRVCKIRSTDNMFDVKLTEQEQAFGDYSPCRFAWITDELIRLEEPVEVTGSQGLFQWEPSYYLKQLILATE